MNVIDSIQVRHLDQIHRVLIADEFNLVKQKAFWVAWQANHTSKNNTAKIIIVDIERRIRDES